MDSGNILKSKNLNELTAKSDASRSIQAKSDILSNSISQNKQSPPGANGHKELLMPLNEFESKDELQHFKNARVFFTTAMMVSLGLI